MMQRLLLFFILVTAAGCSLFGGDDKNESARNWTVDKLYKEAKAAMESNNYQKAVEFFQYLETQFPFGVYGQQSLLDLAYVYYKTNDHEGAISACDRFIRLYPQNPHVDYAYYLKGLVNFNRGRGLTDRIFPKDESQRDNNSAMAAYQDFSELLRRFPDSPYAEDVRQRMIHLRNVLGRYEVNVSHYYMRRGAYVAAANRARYVIENYPRTPAVPDALVLMARAYKILEMNDLAQDALRVLELNYPNHPGIREVAGIAVE